MSADPDDIDARLVAEGDWDRLFAKYYPIVLNRARLQLRNDGDACEVAQRVSERIYREISNGKIYPVPFRVVVHQITNWMLKAFSKERSSHRADPLTEEIEGRPDTDIAGVEERDWLESLFAHLPKREREVMRLRYLEGYTIEEIARQLEISRNAVDQALHRARRRLAHLMGDD
jgi:RNA polymerase sigma factor (sigma-70 family)